MTIQLDNVNYLLSSFEGFTEEQFMKEGFRKDHWKELSKHIKSGDRKVSKKRN